MRSGVPGGRALPLHPPRKPPTGAEISRTRTLGAAQREIYESDLAAGYTEPGEAAYAAAWKANAAGVDLNRNFSADWDSLEGRSEPSSELYAGSQPEDQPESRALAEYTRSLRPDATMSLHTAAASSTPNTPIDIRIARL